MKGPDLAEPILLFGAGASIDAGLPNAYELTRQVYERLPQHSPHERKLYAYVVAKLLTRQSRLGNSPFDLLNVEEVYDALKRFLARDDDVLAEFVYSWDEIASPSRSSFDPRRFADKLGGAFALKQGLSRLGIAPDGRKLRDAADLIAHAFNPIQPHADLEHSLRPYLSTLTECLQSDGKRHPYMERLATFGREHTSAIATLNYDTLLEDACKEQSVTYDYGLGTWNARKFVKFQGADVKLIKLHGSTNWYEDGDDVVLDPEHSSYLRRGLIFGGQGDKLVPHGPYLQLRHEFQRLLRSTNVFGIVGYSFQDRHLNAIIRAWVSSRVKAKLVILDPGTPKLGSEVLGKWFNTDKTGRITRYNVEIQHIAETAANGVEKLIASLLTEPRPGPPK